MKFLDRFRSPKDLRPGPIDVKDPKSLSPKQYEGWLRVVNAWKDANPGEELNSYLATHAGRYARLIDDIEEVKCVIGRGNEVSILDVGGTVETQELVQGQCKISQYDQSPEINLEVDSMSDLVGEEKYDIALCTEVVEHMAADSSFLIHQINRCLKPGGFLIMTTVNITRLASVYQLLTGYTPYVMGELFGKVCDRHQREYAPKELDMLVAAHGFSTTLRTFDSYRKTNWHVAAEDWMRKNVPLLEPELAGDTICVVGKKTQSSEKPRWLFPVFHSSISENRDFKVPPDLIKSDTKFQRYFFMK